jgi:hypothetical protein
MSDALDALPPQAQTVIMDELTQRDPTLLAELRTTDEPTNEQRDAVGRLLAAAIVNNMGADWTPNERGLAAERAVEAFFEKWPRSS